MIAKTLNERLEIRPPRELMRQARQQARRERRPLPAVIRELLPAWLSGRPTASA